MPTLKKDKASWSGATLALVAALLFGASTPFAKVLLGSVDPWLLAGILYLGSGLGLSAILTLRKVLDLPKSEAPLRRGDVPWLALVVLFGGIMGPVLLLTGLKSTSASSASLLLNVESLATMGIAWLVFRENVDRRLLFGAAVILAGAIILTLQPGEMAFGWGAVWIALACLCWGIDNNLTRKISFADPIVTTAIKGTVAGTVNLLLALSQGAAVPNLTTIGAGALIGFFGYGVGLVLFVLALRQVGTARTGAYYSTAPFIGALIAVGLLGEPLTMTLLIAGAMMAFGVWLHLTEDHDHQHAHGEMLHEHRHSHDEHHQHTHAQSDPPGEPHVHVHRHEPMVHRHRHFPDLHHGHGH